MTYVRESPRVLKIDTPSLPFVWFKVQQYKTTHRVFKNCSLLSYSAVPPTPLWTSSDWLPLSGPSRSWGNPGCGCWCPWLGCDGGRGCRCGEIHRWAGDERAGIITRRARRSVAVVSRYLPDWSCYWTLPPAGPEIQQQHAWNPDDRSLNPLPQYDDRLTVPSPPGGPKHRLRAGKVGVYPWLARLDLRWPVLPAWHACCSRGRDIFNSFASRRIFRASR